MADTEYTLYCPEADMPAVGQHSREVASFRQRRAALSAWCLIFTGAALTGSIAGVLLTRSPISLRAKEPDVGVVQHIYVVRHGDKYSSYPACQAQDDKICYDQKLMGINPPLTPCGISQAAYTADWLLQQWTTGAGSINNIVVSPFTRTLQTSLPLAKALGKQLNVEYFISEAGQSEGPFREFNINAPGETVKQLEECHNLWNLSYGGPPIKTPENNTLYVERIAKAAEILKERFPPSSGNLAVFTHATPAFSIAYGLCFGDSGNDQTLKDFVNGQDAIRPAGVIEVIIESDGTCTIQQTRNLMQCGETPAYKCDFEDFPAWYWAHKDGKGPGRCG
mmetsp:Transcript_84812/g.154621  ORF Transcript_84812/g.154621 Transcript_84812/m.154621 type:complete len:336 (+) Transcript_84812:39-1046(+)